MFGKNTIEDFILIFSKGYNHLIIIRTYEYEKRYIEIS